MLERMSDFFEARLEGYEEHMLTCIEGAEEFYPFSASLLPANGEILDLGCGTGLELDALFQRTPDVCVTGIDLSRKMLDVLEKKHSERRLDLVCGSYFEVPLGVSRFDAAISVESLHHFTKEEKIPLYQRLYKALRPNGFFVLTDYFAANEEEEAAHRSALQSLKAEQGIAEGEICHYDIPLTVAHEIEALSEGGFSDVVIQRNWGATYTILATKS